MIFNDPVTNLCYNKGMKNTVYKAKTYIVDCIRDSYNWPEDDRPESMAVRFKLSKPSDSCNPVNFQSQWISNKRSYNVPEEAWDGLWKIREAAKDNNTNFAELLDISYSSDAGEKIRESQMTGIETLEELEYDGVVTESEFAEELFEFSKVLYPKDDLKSQIVRPFTIGVISMFMIEHKCEDAIVEAYKILTEPKEISSRHDNVTYESAAILDSYGGILHDDSFSFIHGNFSMDLFDFNRNYKSLVRALKSFSKKEVERKFEILDIKKMQKNLSNYLNKK